MNKIFNAFLLKFTFQRQLGITIALGILVLALFSSVVGSWQANQRVQGNLLEQGLHITESLARQSALALIYVSPDNAAEAAAATLDFPGVVGVEIRDANRRVLLRRGNTDPAEFPLQMKRADGADKNGTTNTAVLDAESQNAWRFVAPVYSQPASSPFQEEAAPELLGTVTVVVSKAELIQMTTGIFVANLTTSFSFALLILLLIRFLTNRMTQPLNQLSSIMGRAEAGESQVRAVLAGPKDIANMAHAFNSMMAVLEERAAEISQLNTDLERRVAERTNELAAANQELESFSYSVSHDLRTPLRAIDGFSRILLEDYAGKLDDEGTRLLNVVRDNTSRMSQLIDDILNFSRTGRLELTFSRIDMEKLAHTVLAELPPEVTGGNLQVEIEAIPPTKGDSAMMHQVFVNLLSNAIKFSRVKETASIKVGAYTGGGETVYYVQDNGAGFDMQYANKLFGVFQRLHGVTEFEGTGIGLAIVKRIVNRHGGRVWAEGEVGKGATFYFALPTPPQQQS
ncbi:MAG: ATP-binding protein [Gallionella sp.]|nr:ATP-binding protein [Gallionella sp.]